LESRASLEQPTSKAKANRAAAVDRGIDEITFLGTGELLEIVGS
jgi:hypothetical protein